MKRFLYLSIGLMCLSIATSFGFRATKEAIAADASSPVVGIAVWDSRLIVFQSNGDVWMRPTTVGGTASCGSDMGTLCDQAKYLGNYWDGGPVPAAPSTLGSVKGKYR